MGISKPDIKAVLIDGVFGVEFTSIFTEVATIDSFVRKKKMTIAVGKIEVVLLKEFTGGRFPIVITTNKSSAFFVNSKNSAAVGALVDAALLVIDEGSYVFVEEEVWVEADHFGGGGDF